MAIDLEKLQEKFDDLFNDPNFITIFDDWLQNREKKESSFMEYAKEMGFDSINYKCPICHSRRNIDITCKTKK